MIKRSSSQEIGQLIARLDATSDIEREAAIARLAIIGRRASEHLLSLLGTLSSRARAAALVALDRASEPRAFEPARLYLKDPDEPVAIAAIGVVRSWVNADETSVATAALDALVDLTMDSDLSKTVRLAALEALEGTSAFALVRDRLSENSDATFQVELATESNRPAAMLERAAEGAIPEDPSTLKDALASAGATSPLATLHRLIEVIKQREEASGRRNEWMAVRGAVHQTLAARGSTVALYDLRETFLTATTPLPLAFVSAIAEIGDSGCLEPLAASFERSASKDDWWARHAADAFQAVVRRGHITKRHAAMRRIAARWPGLLERLAQDEHV